MKILGDITRLSVGSTFRENLFLVVIDYCDLGGSYYGKSVKNTILSFHELTKCENFNDYKKQIIAQMPNYSLDLIAFRTQQIWQWITKF